MKAFEKTSPTPPRYLRARSSPPSGGRGRRLPAGLLQALLAAGFLLALIAGSTAGCAVGPSYSPPRSPVGEAFAHAGATASQAAAPEEAWWRALGDPQLSQLVDKALAENHDLRIARANVEAARALLREERLDTLPAVTAGGSVTRRQASAAELGGAGADRSATFYEAGFDAAWEVDFFGRVRRSVEASAADYEAAVAEGHDVAVTVSAEVARTYLELRGAQLRLQVAQRNAANQRRTLELTEVLMEAGRGTELDTARARAQLETTLAGVEPLQAAVSRAIHRLGVLAGSAPTSLEELLAAPEPLPEVPGRFAIGDPAGLLRRRSDVRAAERRLAAATARVGVATADLFPRVRLLGFLGFLTVSGVDLEEGRRSSVGPFLSWPAFDLGRVRARIRAADARAEGLLASYERTVLTALEETESSLVELSREMARRERLRVAAEASERAAELAELRYRNGVDSFLTVLDAERRLLEAQDLLAAAETRSALAFVALYKALGGGWELAAT